MQYNFDRRKGGVHTSFFAGGRTNICFNALDRHIERDRGSQPCFLWEVGPACSGCFGNMTLQSILQCRPSLTGAVSSTSVLRCQHGPSSTLMGVLLRDCRAMT